MPNMHSASTQIRVPFGSLLVFLLITFALTWSILGLLMIFPDQLQALFGELNAKNPLFILAVYGPAIVAFGLVLHHGGLKGFGRFLSRLILWKCHWGWYAYLLLGIPLLFYAGAALKGNLLVDPFPFDSMASLLTAMLFMLFLGPMEEFGWRGVALPLLQRRYAPFWAGLILGIIWGLWHLPAFYLSGIPQSTWSFMPFFTGSVAIGIILTPMFNASGGSLLLPVLYHWQLINPIFPDAQPHDTFMFVVAAVIVVLINRKAMFSKTGAATEVIPGETPA